LARIVSLLCLLIAGVCFYVAGRADDIGSRLLNEAGPKIFILTPPGVQTTGGTGFVLRLPDGSRYTVTNRHVCQLAVDRMMEAQGRGLIRVIGISNKVDLCLATAVPGTNSGLELAPSEAQHIYVVGHPYLMPNVLSEGYVVGYEHVFIADPQHGPFDVDAVITSAPIYPGNSGSPAMDASGRVVGVVFASSQLTHYGSMVSLDQLREFLSGI
jgi:serine protease Do